MKRVLVVLGLTAAFVIGSSSIAFAHQNTIFGTVRCDNELPNPQLVTWYNVGDLPQYGNAVITASNRSHVAVGQVITAGTTVQVGQESFPSGQTGTITLTESWFWANDQFTNHNSGSVVLGIDCPVPTSSTPPPTTTPPPTSSTPPPTSSSSTPPPSSSTTPPPATSGSKPPPSSHSATPQTEVDPTPTPTAFTGGSVAAPGALAGLLTLLGLGGLWIARKRTA